jgi:hypothetical protein
LTHLMGLRRAVCFVSAESLKQLAYSEVITLALFQQLRGVESERSFLRDAERGFSLTCSPG